jgi:predicted RNA binding protein YcfA (HicA-like mRNA interferase family)
VGQWGELLEAARRSPSNVRFRDLCGLLERIGYELARKRGSHHIYRHRSRRDLPIVNLQEGGSGKAKSYQVRQILGIVDAHKLEVI